MTLTVTTAHNSARLVGSVAHLDTGTGNAAVRIYGGVRAATVNTAPGSNMLVEIGLTKPSGTVTAGVLTLTQAANGMIAESGTAVWARVVNGNGDTAFDCDCGVSTGEVRLALLTLYAGGDAHLISASLT